MPFSRSAGALALGVLAVCGGPTLAQDVGPVPNGPPVPVTQQGPPGVAPALEAPRPANAGGQPPSGPFGSRFITEEAPPPPPPIPPMPDWLAAPPPGWFLGVQADIVRPSARVINSDGRPGDRTDLDWTVAPEIFLGYRFEHAGMLQLTYRYLESSTGFDFTDIGGPLATVGLEENWIDLAYLTRPLAPWCGCRVQLEAGVRTGFFLLHGHAEDATTLTDGRENFAGIGPELGIHWSWALGESGVAVFGKASAGVLFGRTWARSDQVVADGVNTPTFTSASQGASQTVPDFRAELGLSWTLPRWPWFRLDGGVRGEVFRWDDVVYSDVGPFIRCLVEF